MSTTDKEPTYDNVTVIRKNGGTDNWRVFLIISAVIGISILFLLISVGLLASKSLKKNKYMEKSVKIDLSTINKDEKSQTSTSKTEDKANYVEEKQIAKEEKEAVKKM